MMGMGIWVTFILLLTDFCIFKIVYNKLVMLP